MSAARKSLCRLRPAGLTAAIYAARANLAPSDLRVQWGPADLTTSVENYPGFVDGIDGPDLMETMRKQAERFGTEMLADDVTAVDFRRRPFVVRTAEQAFEGHTVVITTGATAKLLGLPSERALMGRGVSTCATCDGFFFKDQNVMVVAAATGDRGSALSGAPRPQGECRPPTRHAARLEDHAGARARQSKIELIWNSEGSSEGPRRRQGEVGGSARHEDGRAHRTAVNGLSAIGHEPKRTLPQAIECCECYVRWSRGRRGPRVPGVFAAGDVKDFRSAGRHRRRQRMHAALEANATGGSKRRLIRPHCSGAPRSRSRAIVER